MPYQSVFRTGLFQGQTVIVTTQSGGRVRGRVEEVLPDALVLNITRGASVLRRID